MATDESLALDRMSVRIGDGFQIVGAALSRLATAAETYVAADRDQRCLDEEQGVKTPGDEPGDEPRPDDIIGLLRDGMSRFIYRRPVGVGDITVNNPKSGVDIAAAVADTLAAWRRLLTEEKPASGADSVWERAVRSTEPLGDPDGDILDPVDPVRCHRPIVVYAKAGNVVLACEGRITGTDVYVWPPGAEISLVEVQRRAALHREQCSGGLA